MTTQLSGQVDLSSAKEAVALPGTTDVASFTDANLTDTASAFTATIDWGDGTTTTGTVVGSNGSFTVEGGHTYSDEGFPTATVNVTRTADSSQLTMLGTVSVGDTDTINPHGTTITYTINQPLTNVTVATFTDPTNTSNVASDFTAQIDWGDGTTTTGTVQGSNGSFSVLGSHTYTAAGENTISVSIADDFPDAATGSVTSTAVSGFGAHVTLTSATEGTALTGVEVATFADTSGTHVAGDYTATIDWGDGTTTSGTISGSGQSFTVDGSHTYADEIGVLAGESPDMKVTITRTSDAATATATGGVVVADADFLTMTSKTLDSSANQALTNATVATFSDAYTGQIAADLMATIDWGDGSATDIGTVSGSTGSFTVTGSHTYAADGQYKVNVSILEELTTGEGQIGAVTSTANVGLAAGSGSDFSVLEGSPTANGMQVATFFDGNTSETASAFTAAIDWGDGTTTTGTVSGSNGSFTVTGGPHSYADEGDETVTTTVTRIADNKTAVMTGTGTVGEADALAVTANNISGNSGQAFNNIAVATFTDGFTGNVASDLTATINWGDGTTSTGTIVGSNGAFTVDGSHTYATGGNYTTTVTVADDSPGTATGAGTAAATINPATQMVLTAATEHTALPGNTAVATFSDSNLSDTAGSFTATINWGDGTTTAGTVTGSNGSFTVAGGHTYADEGNEQASVTLTRTADNAQSTASGSVAVTEADALTAQNGSVTLHSGQASIVATFSDTDHITAAGDFTGTINWGDGTTTAGTVSGGKGSFTVNGSHTYASSNTFVATVTLADDAPGTASSTLLVPVNPPPPHSTTADMITDRSSTGDYEIYDIGNNTVLAAHPLTQISSSSQVVGLGGFDGSDTTDMMPRNTATGSFEIVDVSNNNATGAFQIGNVGLDWSVAGFGDLSGNPNDTGQFEIYDITNNQVTDFHPMGQSGLEWRVDGVAKDPPTEGGPSSGPISAPTEPNIAGLTGQGLPDWLGGNSWLTQAMQAASLSGAGIAGTPMSNASLTAGPGFGGNNDPIAGPNAPSSAQLATSALLQNRTG